MADVGVLNLQIHDDSSKAAEGLGRLATKLESVKKAAQGLNLGNLAKQISNIGKAVEEQVHGSTIEKLNQLSEALQKVKSACEGINIPNLGGLKNIASATSGAKKSGTAMLDGVKESVEATKAGLQEIGQEIQQTSGTDEAVKNMEDVNNAVQETKQSVEELNSAWHTPPKYEMEVPFSKPGDVMRGNDLADLQQRYNARYEMMARQEAKLAWIREKYADSSDSLKQSIGRIYGIDPATITHAREETQQLAESAQQANTALQEVKSTLQGTAGTAVSDTTAAVQNEAKAAATAAQAAPALAEMKSEAQSAASGIREVSGAAGEMTDSVSRGSSAVGTIKSSFRQLGEATKSLLSPLTGIISSLGRVARYRMLRAVIKQVTEGIKEGTENYYRYSNAIGSSFAPAMDSVSSSLSQMKNSIGAAAAPAISAVIPILNSIISLAITAINYLNQLIALLRGQSTWSRATTQSAKAFDDVADSAGGAGSAVKDLLADWDELNIIQSESGGGGGGGASAMSDWLNMFEEVSEFNKTIQDIVDGINDQFGSVLNLIGRIGAAILAWKLSTALTGGLATLASLAAAGIIIGLVFDITTMLDKKYFETGEIGWLVADVITTAIGSYLAGKVVSKVLGTGAGYVAASITLGVSALADIIALAGATDVSALSEESILTSIKAALKLGTGMFLIGKAANIGTRMSAALGIEAAAIGIGVTLGIKAVASTVETGEITQENVLALVAGAASVALGVTAAELMAGTAVIGAVAAGGIAGGAFLLAFGVAIGVAALINMNKDDIKWGDVVLTDEEVQDFVGTRLVTVDINVATQLIAKNVEVTNTQKSAIATKITQALGTFKVIQLGLADKEDYSELHEQVDGLITEIQGYITAAKETGKLTLQFTPSLVGSTEGDQASWFKNYSSGWDTVNKFAETTGKEIGKYLVKGEKEQLSQSESEILAELMGQMSRVSAAIADAQIAGEALTNLQFGIGDISKKSAEDISEAFATARSDLETQYRQLVSEQVLRQEKLVAGLFEVDPNSSEYKQALASLQYMRANMLNAVNQSVEEAILPGKKYFADLILDHYGDELEYASEALGQMTFDTIPKNIDGVERSAEELAQHINERFVGVLWRTNSDLAAFIESAGLDAWTLFSKETKAAIIPNLESIFGEDMTKQFIDLWEHNSPVQEIVEETRKDFEGMPDVQAENNVELTTTVTENTEFVEGETTGELTDMTGATGGLVDSSPVQQATGDVKELAQTTQETATTINAIKLDALNFDTSQAEGAANSAAATFESMASRIRSAILSLRGLAYSFSGGMWGGSFAVTIPAAAEGGIFHSGDVFSANENGSAELIGRYGNNTAVANNEQIVTGITRGVAQGNDSVVSALQTLVTVAQQIQRKEFTAKVVPSSGVGRNNQQSADAYSLITG